MIKTASAAVLALAGACAAQVHESDILIKIDGPAIITGAVVGGEPIFPARLFTAELGEFGIPNTTTEPGFDSLPGAFPPGTIVGLSIRKALRIWDGDGFDTIPALERMEVVKSGTAQTPAVDPPTCEVGESVELGQASSNGTIHQHAAFILTPPAADGVYLLELEAWAGIPGGLGSLPFWILFDQSAPPEVLDEALGWAAAFLTCTADFNRDAKLNIEDFISFQLAFALGDPRADLDMNCLLNIDDFIAFQLAFALGCDPR